MTNIPIKNSFDPDLSPDNEANRDAAEERRLRYDPAESVYRDEDGCPVLDEFGQPLG
jgi:hypothetical protein